MNSNMRTWTLTTQDESGATNTAPPLTDGQLASLLETLTTHLAAGGSSCTLTALALTRNPQEGE